MKPTSPEVFDHELRAAGFTAEARNHPRSEMGARWLAWFNGVNVNVIPASWWYASSQYMLNYCEEKAFWAMQDLSLETEK